MDKELLIEKYIKKAEEAQEKNKELKALNLYLKANELANGEEIEVLLNLALIYHNLEEIEEAKSYYSKILDISEDEYRAYYGLAIIYDENLQYEKAIELYNKAIYINPNYKKAYFFLANIYDTLGEKEKAIEYYEKLISIDSEDFWGNINLGSIYEELNRNSLAYKRFKKALDIDKEHYMALFNMGVITNKLNLKEKAIEFYKKSVKKNPGYPYSFLNLAVLYKASDIRKGIEILTQGIKYNSVSHFLYYNRGCFYAITKEYEASLKDLEKALELYPEFMKYILEDEELKEIKFMKEFSYLIEKYKHN